MYTGRNLDPLPVGSLDYYWEIGYATIDPVYIKNLNAIEDKNFSVYPNPVHDVIRLNIHLKESIEVNVTNIVGEMLINVQNQSYIDVSQLPSGIYYLTLTQNQQKCTKKFIKN